MYFNKNLKIFSIKNLVLRTIAMPLHINANGDIFGGWIMSQMDLAGAILAKEISSGKVSTVQVNNMNFLKPISSGDLITCYAKCINIGNSSLTIDVELWIKKLTPFLFGTSYRTTYATFIYVAIDQNGKKRIIPNMTIL
ncbi:acyl-CoA thioester hydrolase YciA [Buchnera aphidicola]|uniref:Acyl-CoA thioester hydrolase YciA n=1 Tax=Buchnera aphidicola subsp. Tuberolachnus salignus TaxID=98804 RepID=A0A170PBR1_BUCTT|nr:acyl-CoA thioester hydrolase YciA [Buchnera aphidicola]CUR53159.1 Acyl-CoA thioester hydrolase YciA [Buchnera aphidicola (Tuberolachnus salignus)]